MKMVKDYLIVFFYNCIHFGFIFRKDVTRIGKFGYIGVFLLCFLSNLTVFLPSPGLLVVISYASVLSPILGCIIGALGSIIFGNLYVVAVLNV